MSTPVRSILLSYVSYVAFFLGIGLISGAIVHMPIDPSRYLWLLVIGVSVFVLASFWNEVYVEKKRLSALQLVGTLLNSLLLSIGIGMIGGGIQHYGENPAYSAYLIPIGVAISFGSFALKYWAQLTLRKVGALIAICLVLVLPLRFTLSKMADAAGIEEHTDGAGHSH